MDRARLDQICQRLRDGERAEQLEGPDLEFKRWPLKRGEPQLRVEHEKVRSWLREYAVCFANADGGALILGIDPGRAGAEALEGCVGYDLDRMRAETFDGTAPPITADISEYHTPGATLLVVSVPKSPRVHATTDGRRFRREGRRCRPLLPEDDALVHVEKGGDYSARLLAGAGRDVLDPLEVERLRAWARRHRQGELGSLDAEALLRALELVHLDPSGRGRPTVAGVLLCGRHAALRELLPQAELLYFRFAHDELTPVQTLNVRLPLLALIDRVWELVEPHNDVVTLRDGLLELEVPSYSEEVVREGLLNAVTHRSWVDAESISVRLYRDRLEIGSPGGFIGGITPDNILTHEPKRRNPLLAAAFQTLGAVNRAGIGVDRMYRALLAYGKRPPEYPPQEQAVRLVIHNGSCDEAFARYVNRLTREGRDWGVEHLIVLHHLARHESITAELGSALLQRPAGQAAAVLATMEGAYLERFGRGRGTYYRLTRTLYDQFGGATRYARDRGLDEKRMRALILDYVEREGKVANQTAQQLCGISRAQAKQLLAGMCAEGLLGLVGRGRGAHYTGARSAL